MAPKTDFDKMFDIDTSPPTEMPDGTPLPTKCITCMTGSICSPLNTFINLLRVGIKIEVSRCPFFIQAPKSEKQ